MGWFNEEETFYKEQADKLRVEVEFWKVENGKNVNTAEQLLHKLERNMAELNKLDEEVKYKDSVIETLKKDIKFLSDRQKEKTDMTKDEALKMAIEALEDASSNSTYWEADMSHEEFLRRIQTCKEALAQPTEYLYVYKGSEIWIKDSLDIPSAGFLIGKIRLEK